MENKKFKNYGIEILVDLPWGTHFCSFYRTKQDFLELLIPFFEAGLENNEFCLWITDTPFTVNEALQTLKKKAPNLEKYIETLGIEIISHNDWYLKEDIFNPKDVTARWHRKLNMALEMGYIGMRVNAGEGWLKEQNIWRDFIDYEMALNSSIFDKRITMLCSYPLEKCTASMILDVAHVHEIVLSKRNNRWEILEALELKKTKTQLNRMNEMLEEQVSERTKELETALAKLKEEIADREKKEEELAEIANDLIQRSTDLQQFAYIVSHNLRAPVANIIGLSDILKGDISNGDKSKIAQFLFKSVESLDEIVKDLNNILEAKFEITEKNEKFHMSEIVDIIKLSLQNFIENEKAQILTDFSAIDEIKTIKSYLYSIFFSLIQNSIRYKHPDRSPIIQIKSVRYNAKIRILFKDNGIGIDMKKYGDKIFGLYKRFHPGIEGKGLGLFMVKTHVEVLGGSISVKSEAHVGTEFTIELPVGA